MSMTPTGRGYPRSVGRGRGIQYLTEAQEHEIFNPRVGPIPSSISTTSSVTAITTSISKLTTDKPSSERRRNKRVPPTRPESLTNKQGSAGQPVKLIANYIRILATSPNWQLYQYMVQFSPEVYLRKTRRQLLSEHKNIIQDVAFDGQTLYSFDDLGPERHFRSSLNDKPEFVDIHLTRTTIHQSESPTFFYLANLLVRKLLEISGLKLLGRQYYQFDKKIDFERYKLSLFPGFMTNVNLYEGILMINVDLSHKVLNKTSVYSRLQDIFAQYNEYKKAKEMAVKELIGQIVLTTYNNKTYKIIEIDWDKDPKYVFTKVNGKEQTLMEYYKERYEAKIVDETQPLLIVKQSRREGRMIKSQGPILLIPELCCVTGISDMMRADFHVMKELAQHTQVPPQLRYNRLKGFVDDIRQNSQTQAELKKWKIEFDNDLVEFNARVLEIEPIIYGNRTIKYKPGDADWSRESRSLTHLSAKNLRKWLVLYTQRDHEIAESFINTLHNVCTPFGMDIQYPQMIKLANDQSETYLKALQDNQQSDMDLVLCLLTNNRKDRYDTLKKHCCIDKAIPSQMVLTKTLSKRGQLMSIATKIGIQINAKLGGEIWSVQIPSKTLMIIGIDSYSQKKSGNSHVDAFVASINPSCTRFYSRIIVQNNSQDFILGMEACLQGALKEYHTINNSLPDRIIIYRDNLVDHKLTYFIENDLPKFVSLFSKISTGYDPKIAVIIVSKKNTARFFARLNHELSNPLPGTIIDHTITNQEWYDFYLISQCIRQGTVTPTHFNVIWDTTQLKVDHMQRLTWKLCHMYYNWPGTIRVPAVCQYAHKLAFLTAQSLHEEFDQSLCNKLFYL